MQEYQKGCKKNSIRAEEEQKTAARAKQHGDEEEDSGIGPAGREKIREQREKHGEKKQNKQARKQVSLLRFRAPPNELNENKQKLPLTAGFRAMVAHVPLISRTGTLPHLSLIHI